MGVQTTKLFHKDFNLVVIGQIISLFGNAILRFALPLYLLRETGSASLFGAVSACSFLPMIVLSLVGGVLADRANKRNIMVILDFATAGLIVICYLALGRVPLVPLLVVVLMLLYGISGTYQPTVQASIPLLAPGDKLMTANAVINQVGTLSGLLGPVVGGVLFGAFGIFPVLVISALCFFASAVMEIFISIPFVKQPKGQNALAVARDDLTEGFRFVKYQRPIFFSVGLVLAAFNLVLSSMIMVGIPILVVQVLGLSDALLGFAQGALALGGLAGGIMAAILAKKLSLTKSHFLLVVCALAAAAGGVSLLWAETPMLPYTVLTIGCFVAMAASTLFTIQLFTLIQRETPSHLLGKIMSVLMAITMCAQPVGQAMYGLLFDAFLNQSWAILLGAALVSVCIALYSKTVFVNLEASAQQNAPANRARGVAEEA